MTRRLVTAIYWLALGLNGLFWLFILNEQWDSAQWIGLLILSLPGLLPFGVLPVIRWVRTGEWHVDPR